MPSEFYLTFVASTDTTFSETDHVSKDLSVLSFDITHNEGDFAILTVAVKNPKVGLLAAGRQQWAWFASEEGTDGPTPLFFGRLVAYPQAASAEVISLTFRAKPLTYAADKAALAVTLKEDSRFYDPVFFPEEQRADPNSALEARPEVWHVDRVTHDVTSSSIVSGEDGTINLAGSYFYDSLDMRYGQIPGRSVAVSAEVYWEQQGKGSVDLKQSIINAGGGGHSLKTYTGEGLANAWPSKGDSIGSGWTVGNSEVRRGDGLWVPEEVTTVIMKNASTVDFPLWTLRPTFYADYDATRSRKETLAFTLSADVQSLVTDPDEGDDLLTIYIASSDVGEPIDAADSDNPDGALPIRDRSYRSYFPTERGLQSVEFLISLARTQLLRRARAVELSFETTWANGLSMSCRKNVTIADDRIPGGTATGKIISYSLVGNEGKFYTRCTIGCMIGAGNSVAASAGTPTVFESGYVDTGYQFYSGQTTEAIAGEVTYTDFSDTEIVDDGIDFDQMTPTTILDNVQVINPASTQKTALRLLDGGVDDIAEAISALQDLYTEVLVELTPLVAGPFETSYAVTVSDLMVPKTIDLEAA